MEHENRQQLSMDWHWFYPYLMLIYGAFGFLRMYFVMRLYQEVYHFPYEAYISRGHAIVVVAFILGEMALCLCTALYLRENKLTGCKLNKALLVLAPVSLLLWTSVLAGFGVGLAVAFAAVLCVSLPIYCYYEKRIELFE